MVMHYYNQDEWQFVPFHCRTKEVRLKNLPYRKQVAEWTALRDNVDSITWMTEEQKAASKKTYDAELQILAEVMWLSPEKAAEEIEVPLRRILFWLSDGQIKAHKLKGGKNDWLIHRGDFEDFLESRMNVPPAQSITEMWRRQKGKRNGSSTTTCGRSER